MKTKALAEQAKVAKPVRALTVYPPNKPVKLVHRVLPSKVKSINIFALIQLFLKFEKTCKTRITPTGLTEGERVTLLFISFYKNYNTHDLLTPSCHRPPPATTTSGHHHHRRRKTFLASFSGEPQKRSSHPDLQDLTHHSPPRAAATSTSSATTTAVVNTPPKPPRIHHHHHPAAVHPVTIIFISSPSTAGHTTTYNTTTATTNATTPSRVRLVLKHHQGAFGICTSRVHLVSFIEPKDAFDCCKPIRVRLA
nr:hypothetical protein [Tanacetum cinerariifolium]